MASEEFEVTEFFKKLNTRVKRGVVGPIEKQVDAIEDMARRIKEDRNLESGALIPYDLGSENGNYSRDERRRLVALIDRPEEIRKGLESVRRPPDAR